MAAILNMVDGRRREMLVNVDSGIFKSGLVENVGIEVEITSISQAVQKLLPLPFLRPPSWICGFRLHVTTSAVAPLDSLTSKMGVAVGISFPCAIELDICLGSVATTPLGASRQ